MGDAASALRPADRADVARFYNVVLAVAVWNDVARQIAAARKTTMPENARMLALLNMAISDGLVTVMETKYHYRFWRPETAIQAGDADGNPGTGGNTAFTPYIPAPCFPSYPSAHASGSYAAREILARIYGGIHFRFDQRAGAKQGRSIGAYIHRRHLRPARVQYGQ